MFSRFPIILLDLLVLAGVCKGFDFTFHKPSSNKPNVQPGEACGVLRCTATITGGADDGRKIQSLDIYRHKSSDVSGLDQWEQLASVTSQTSRVRRVSDAKHTVGTLSDTAARIEVRLVKSRDCDSLKFACICRLEDANGGVTTIKSVFGGSDGPSGDSEMESYGTGQHDITGKVEISMATQDTTQTSRVLNNKLDSVMSTVLSLVAETHNLTTEVGVLSHPCADKSPTPVSEYFDVFQDGRREWRLAFRGTAYNNVLIYPAYLYGTGIPAEVELSCRQFNHSVPCANHYRNTDAFDNWANVDEVLLALYVKSQMVKYISFNGRGSTWINWFEANRVIGSSWSDLKTKSHNFFSIEGHSKPNEMRRFYVNHSFYYCLRDQGWFVAADAVPGNCSWERIIAHPAFMYAKGNSVTIWNERHTVGRADAMGVFIKYQ